MSRAGTSDSAAGTGLGPRDALIVSHMPLLRHIAGRLSLDLPRSFDREDLVGFGMIGLIAAADSWDESRGLQFSTYAYTKIRGAILDELRKQDFLSRGRRERVRELDRVTAELEQRLGCPPSPEELAEALGTDVDEIGEILLAARSALEASLDDGSTETLGALLADPSSVDPVGSAEWNEMKVLLVRAIGDLPEQEKTVITLYYAEELLLREIAEVLGVTDSRVSQIHSRAIFRLNRALSGALETREEV